MKKIFSAYSIRDILAREHRKRELPLHDIVDRPAAAWQRT